MTDVSPVTRARRPGAAVLLAPLAALATIPVAVSAAAQSTTSTPQSATPILSGSADAIEASSPGEQIVVTGSRIRRAGVDTLEPATVLSSEYLSTRGLTNVADALNEIPGFGVGINPTGNQSGFGVGQNFVNYFGLGSARTLTLVDGRRFVSTNAPSIFGNLSGLNGPGLQVDLNVIPAQLVDRIETVAVGGAPTYGSDAIAGTVNVILKKDYQGVSIQGLGGVTQRGDNGRYNASFLAGRNFGEGRGNITIAGSYDKSTGVLASERKIFQQGIATGTNPIAGSATATLPGRSPATDGRVDPNVPYNVNSTDGVPSTVYIRNARIFSLTAGGLLVPAAGATVLGNGLPAGLGAANALLQFDPSGNLIPYDPGIPFGAQNASGGDGFNLTNDTSQLTSDLERITGNLIGHYELADHLNAFVEGTYYRAKARELIDQSIYNATLFGGASAPLTFSATDPRLSPQARAQLAALGVSSFRLSRASRDLVSNNASSITNVYRGVAGVDGDFSLFGRRFTWEASADLGHSRASYFANVLNQQNFVNAINVTTNAAGQIVCNPNVTAATNVAPGGVLPVADPACVPLNVFGEGVASAAARAYVTGRTRAVSTLDQRVYNINVGSASLVRLWSGDVGVNAGYEHRLEKADFEPDAFQRAALGRSVAIMPNSGGFSTDEAFGEFIIPLIAQDNHIPLVHALTAEGRARFVHNTVNGGFWAYTYGGRYEPVRGIEFRGNYTRSLRAPSVVELFTPVSPAFNTFPDPCDMTNIAAGVAPAIRARNCAAFFQSYGINGASFNSLARVATVPVTSGGNTALRNEEGRSYTIGMVLTPRFLPRFRASVDWSRIVITGNIASLTPANIAEGCYDNPDFNAADVDNANAFCSLIRRDRSADAARNGQLSIDANRPAILGTYVNGAFISFKGLNAQVEYSQPLDGIGVHDASLRFSGLFFYRYQQLTSNNGVTVTNLKGTLGYPIYSGQANVGLNYRQFSISIQGDYQSRQYFDRTFTAETRDILSVGSYWLFNASLGVDVTKNSQLRFVISNLFDRDPPFPLTTNGLGVYDYLGRRFAVSFNVKL